MRRHQNALAGENGGGDFVLPQRQHPLQRDFQVFAVGHGVGGQMGVAAVFARGKLVVFRQERRQGVVAAAPDVHLVGAVFFRGLLLVQTLQRAVVALVQAPAFGLRHPQLAAFFQHDVAGFDGAGQHRRERLVEFVAGSGELLPRRLRFGNAFFAQIDVAPAGKQVFGVPFALAVADKYKFHHCS